ncbi:MAG: hypothetical protein ABJL99_27365 [Aliishimia sp.]
MNTHPERLAGRLTPKSLLKSPGFIAGGWVKSQNSSKTFDVTNPSTNAVIATLPDMGVAQTKAAIDTAYDA